jgi:protein involved in polysaccharide export with SLBB domain
MDHGQRSTRKRSGSALLSLIPFCLIMLLGSPAGGQSNDRLAPQDTVEIRVSGWTALRGGVAEASMLTDAFTIGSAGSLELPIIGHVPAAGLRADELAKLITDRLQARSGLTERPVTTVQLKQYPSLAVRGSVERPGKYPYRPNLTVQEAIEAAGGVARIEETGTQLTLSISRSVGRVRELTVARNSLVLPGDIIWVGRTPAPETRTARIFTDRSSAGDADRTNTEERRLAAKPSLAGSRAEQQQAPGRERSRTDALLRDLSAARREAEAVRTEALAARREIDALKDRQQTAGDEREHALRRELGAAREELDTMRHAARDASAKAHAVADTTAEQARALEEQRQRAERLARDLTVAQHEVEGLNAKAVLVDREMGASRAARHAAQASLSQARRALDEERRKAEHFELDLAAARQSIDALEARANLAAAAQAAASQGRQVAEAALKRVGEQFALERERAASAARDLDSAHKERDAAKQEVTRVSAELEQERDKAIGLARDVSVARKEIDMLKAQGERRTARIEPAPKAHATENPRVSKRPSSEPAHQSGSWEIRKVEVRKPSRPVRLTTIALPDGLLPTRLTVRGLP